MKNLSKIGIIAITAIIGLSMAGCNQSSDPAPQQGSIPANLVGTWVDTEWGDTLTLRANGTFTLAFNGFSENGIFSVSGNNFTITFPGESPQTGPFSQVGNTLTIFIDGEQLVFTRQGAGSQPTAPQPPAPQPPAPQPPTPQPPVVTFTPPSRAQIEAFLENRRTTATIGTFPASAYIRSITINSYTVNGVNITTNPSPVPENAEVRVQFTLRTILGFNTLTLAERLHIDNFRLALQRDLQDWLESQGFGFWNITITTGNTVFG